MWHWEESVHPSMVENVDNHGDKLFMRGGGVEKIFAVPS